MIPIPYRLLAGIVAALAITLAGYCYGKHQETLAFDAYKAEQAAAAEKQVATNQTAVAAITASEAAGLRQIASDAQESRNEVQKRNDALVAANSTLAGQLQRYLAGPGSRPAVVPKTSAGGPDNHATSEPALSVGLQQFTGWLTGQFYEADRLAVNLTAAQQVIQQDREICNGTLPGN
jgi:hypothetical protein